MKPRFILTGLIAATALVLPQLAFAQFAPAGATISGTVGAQTLSANTGTINVGGAISIASGGTVPLAMTGTSTLINNGTIQTLGTGRAIDSNSGTANLTVTNTGLISSVSTDAFRVNTNSAVSLTNSGTIQVTAGGQAIDWVAITSASNSLTNQFGGTISSVGEDAVRPGTNGIVINAGTISATPTGGASPTGSDGIDVRTFTGIQVTNTGMITGRHGIATDGANVGPSAITVNNNTGGTILAINGSGLNIDGVSVNVTANVTNQSGATIQGAVLAAATNGDGDGLDIDGVLTLNNSGNVFGNGAKGVGSDTLPNGAQAISIGGGTIINNATGQIVGSSLLADAPNGDATRIGEGILADNSSGGNAIAATSVTNDGLIRGKSGAGIRIIGTFADTITNNATGTIRGAGASAGAAIQTGDGGDIITNKGAIIGDNGSAIAMEGGSDTLNIQGGAASVTGNIDGGAGTNTLKLQLGVGNTFTYSTGTISNFASVEVESGTTMLDGANRIAATSALDMKGGYLKINDAGGANGQTFATLTLGDNSTLDLDNSTSVTFNSFASYTPGKTLSLLNFDVSVSPDWAIRFAGDYTADASFLALIGSTTVNGDAALYSFSGGFTNVVPEPSTLVALLSGAGLLALRRRRN